MARNMETKVKNTQPVYRVPFGILSKGFHKALTRERSNFQVFGTKVCTQTLNRLYTDSTQTLFHRERERFQFGCSELFTSNASSIKTNCYIGRFNDCTRILI